MLSLSNFRCQCGIVKSKNIRCNICSTYSVEQKPTTTKYKFPGSYIEGIRSLLLLGLPGSGKSTLALMLAAKQDKDVYFIAGEQQPYEIRKNFKTFGGSLKKLFFYPGSPGLTIIDSVPTVSYELDDVPDINPVILINQVNADEESLGGHYLEHMVDSVIYVAKQKDISYCTIRKNRGPHGPDFEFKIRDLMDGKNSAW